NRRKGGAVLRPLPVIGVVARANKDGIASAIYEGVMRAEVRSSSTASSCAIVSLAADGNFPVSASPGATGMLMYQALQSEKQNKGNAAEHFSCVGCSCEAGHVFCHSGVTLAGGFLWRVACS